MDAEKDQLQISVVGCSQDVENQALSKDYEAVLSEWEAVTTIVLSTQNQQQNKIAAAQSNVYDCDEGLTSDDVFMHFRRHSQLLFYKRNIKPIVPYSGWRHCLNKLFGPPSLSSDLLEDRDLLFAMASWSFDNTNNLHIKMLNTIYKLLLGNKLDPPRYGTHWDDIGFQGADPSTDLRGCGCLGLINLTYFLLHQKYCSLALEIFHLSRDPVQNFPFCVMSINITRMALQALRKQLLNREANRENDIIGVFNEYYVGCYFQLYLLWKRGRKTIGDSGFVLKEAETFCYKNVKEILNTVRQMASSTTTCTSANHHSENLIFTNMDQLVTDQ